MSTIAIHACVIRLTECMAAVSQHSQSITAPIYHTITKYIENTLRLVSILGPPKSEGQHSRRMDG